MDIVSIELLEQRRLLSLTLLGPATDVPGDSGPPLVAVAGNGTFAVARITGDMDALSHSLVLVRYSAAGEQIGSAITVASGASVDEASVSMDADGDAVVAYANNGIFVERISKTGVTSAPTLIASKGAFAAEPSVSMDSSGGYFLGWVQEAQANGDIESKVQAFDADGTSRGAGFTVSSMISLVSLDELDITSKPDGSGAVFADVEFAEGARDTIQLGRVSTTALIGSLGSLNSGLNEGSPSVAVNSDGSFEIGYTTFDKDGGSGGDPIALSILAQRFDASGLKQGGVITLRSSSEDSDIPQDIFHTPSGFVSIDAKAGGGFIAVYSRVLDTNIDSLTTPISVQDFDAQGVADSDGPLVVATNSANEQIGIDDNGNAVVGFSSIDGSEPLRFTRVSTTADFASVQNGELSVFGTADDDTISIAVSGSNLIVTRGTDTRTFTASTVTSMHIDGLEGSDTITNSTAIPSTLEGGDGDDTLFGGSSADRLDGGAGSDSLWGEGGNDRLAGDEDHDYLFGNGGNDKIYGGLQPDFIRGNDGHDHLYGNGGNDVIYGGASNDSLYGQGGNDQLFGEGGNDRLYADYATGVSTLHGGAGDDELVAANGRIDQLFGDGGHDSATADASDILTSIESPG